MMSITNPRTSEQFTKAMEEIHSRHIKALGKITDLSAELCHSHKQFIRSALDASMKKCKDDDLLFDTIESFKKDLEQKGTLLREKRLAISDVMFELEQKEMAKDEILHKIEKIREEQARRREVIYAQNKANKNRLKNLQNARQLFQDSLGLEIRSIFDKSEVSRKVQFVFRNINPSNLNSAFTVTMGIDAEGMYQIVSRDPAVDGLSELEKLLQETNNLAAFLANIRKKFIALVRH